MVAVKIGLVKTLQIKLQETYHTILKYKNEIFVPSFVFIGSFLRPAPAVFLKNREILNISSREKHHYMQISNFPKFHP